MFFGETLMRTCATFSSICDHMREIACLLAHFHVSEFKEQKKAAMREGSRKIF